MMIDRHSSPLIVLCLTILTALGASPAASASDELTNGLGGSGPASHGNDGVGGIERYRTPGYAPGNTGPGSLPGTVIPINPTPPNGSPSSTTYGAWFNLGFGLPGVTTHPMIELVLYSQVQTVLSLLVTDGLPGNDIYLVAGLKRQPTPFKGGVLVPSPEVLLTGLSLNDQGELLVPLADLELLPPLMLIYIQAWMPDDGNALGFSSTNAIALLIP